MEVADQVLAKMPKWSWQSETMPMFDRKVA
jgi:hypothetical protein